MFSVVNPMRRSVFFLSDHTGITAETLGRSLLTQFEGIEFQQTSWPFLDNMEKAESAVSRINRAAREDGCRPLVFSTIVDTEVRKVILTCRGAVFDFFDAFNDKLENELGQPALHATGRSHGIGDFQRYASRIDALNFSLSNDDGLMASNYPASDIILLGVSRSGKTPTCLYLALQYGVLAANYPLTEDDLKAGLLPKVLAPYRDRLFGLTIDPDRLHRIRTERYPDSRYSQLRQCQFEVDAVESLYRREAVPFVNTTSMSIEEIAATIMQRAGIQRRLYG
ncbi:hypothetical protein SAMN03097708_00062 [Thiohalomonas denitrificans]|uniref:Putative phosphoenolpyruvate synthase regulatory protein n=2 Tax=Thiohalomonas denitrificans TaxID=415747 RepID=A0A1G5PJB1_9GAMM|nr:hypothetical protein SAMN03097708_00062 [Thiohalomonas denitrificans]